MINILRTVVSRVKRMSAEGRFSVRCAENCGNDRLHRREVNVYMPYIRQLAVTKTVVMAMKTVVMEIRCRMPWKYLSGASHITVHSPATFCIFDSPGVKVVQNAGNTGK